MARATLQTAKASLKANGCFRTIAYLHRGPLAQLGQSTGLLIRVSRVRIPDGPRYVTSRFRFMVTWLYPSSVIAVSDNDLIAERASGQLKFLVEVAGHENVTG